MAYKYLPAGSSFRVCRKIIRDMFNEMYSGLKSGAEALGNFFEVESDGTWVNHGDSTTWDDIVQSLVASRLESVVGKLKYNYDNNTITMEPGGVITNSIDRLIMNSQYPHAAKTDGEMRLHIHWEQTDATAREFTVQYRIQHNGNDKTTAWQTVVVDTSVNNVFDYTSGTLMQITNLVAVDMTGAGISATVQFRIARTDSVAVDLESHFIDSHIERDMNGSREEFIK